MHITPACPCQVWPHPAPATPNLLLAASCCPALLALCGQQHHSCRDTAPIIGTQVLPPPPPTDQHHAVPRPLPPPPQDTLINASPSRIINMASAGEFMADVFKNVDWYDLKGRHAGESGPVTYARSKMYFIAWSYELARRLKGSGVDVFAVHPGGGVGWGVEDGCLVRPAGRGWLSGCPAPDD
jgi:NAD(P)-dependent dehydrogenase (short-subunit alcohol dehydrogenase family)